MNNKSKNLVQKIVLLALTLLTLYGCTAGISGTWMNDSIDKDKRAAIKEVNDKLFKAIINKDIAGIKALMSQQLIEKAGKDLEQLISQAGNALHSESYRILDEYNVNNSSAGINTTLPSGIAGDNDYLIKFQALNKESYVSLLLPNDTDNELLITAIYGNYNNEWKLNILQFGQYSLFHKTAADYYKLAKESYDKSYLIDAVNYAGLAKECLKPANQYLQYQKEKEIIGFYEQVMQEANTKYVFPLTLENIDTKPKLFRIMPEMINEGFFPIVYYLSSINLEDTAALKIENNKIKKEVYNLFKGINKDKKYVFFKAVNEIPDGKKSIEQFGFVDQLAE